MVTKTLITVILYAAITTAAPCCAETSAELTQRGIKELQTKPLQDKQINSAIALFESATVKDKTNTLARKDLAMSYNLYGLSLWRTEPTQALHEFEVAYYVNPTDDIYRNLKTIPVAKLIASGEDAERQQDLICAHSLYLLALKQKTDPKIEAKLRKVDLQIKNSKLPYCAPISAPLK